MSFICLDKLFVNFSENLAESCFYFLHKLFLSFVVSGLYDFRDFVHYCLTTLLNFLLPANLKAFLIKNSLISKANQYLRRNLSPIGIFQHSSFQTTLLYLFAAVHPVALRVN